MSGLFGTLTAAAYFSFNDRHGAVVYEGDGIAKLLEEGQARLIATVEAIDTSLPESSSARCFRSKTTPSPFLTPMATPRKPPMP